MDTLFTDTKGCLVVIPRKRLDTNNSPDVEKVITDKIHSGENKVIFDFDQTDYVSSAGLCLILLTAKELKQKKANGIMQCQ